MSRSVYFNGELLTTPGAYSSVDTSLMATKGDNEGAKVIAFIGELWRNDVGEVTTLD